MRTEERLNDAEEATRMALDGRQADIWTSIPGIIQSFNPDDMTATVLPAIKYNVSDRYGVVTLTQLPLLLDCPVQFIGGGGYTLTFLPKNGDECLMSFAQRCIDAWWQNGGVQPQAEFRMHDPSDGFCIPGFRSKPRVLPNILATGTELRSDDRTKRITINDSGLLELVNSAGSFHLDAAGNCEVSGNLTVGGTVTATGEGTFNGAHTVSHHIHSDPQGGSVGFPTG